MAYVTPTPVVLVDVTGTAYSASGGGAGSAGAIKGSGVAAQTTDSSQVVALSPNSALPSGANTIGAVTVSGVAQDATFAQATGSATLGALNALLQLTPGRKGTALVQVTGTFVATLSLLGSVDNTNYVTFGATPQFLNLNTGAYTATITAPGIYQTSLNGMVGAQVKATAYTSGSAVVTVSLTDSPAMVALDAAIPAGGNNIGNVTLAAGSNTVGTINNAPVTGTALLRITTADTNAVLVKTGSSQLFQFDYTNTSGVYQWVKFFNKASAPVAGGDTPVLMIPVANAQTLVQDFGPIGKAFPLGLGFCITASGSGSDATAIAANSLLGLTYR